MPKQIALSPATAALLDLSSGYALPDPATPS